ncbi:hypothetical protein GCM10009714_18340 [Microlunatus capsulatus]
MVADGVDVAEGVLLGVGPAGSAVVPGLGTGVGAASGVAVAPAVAAGSGVAAGLAAGAGEGVSAKAVAGSTSTSPTRAVASSAERGRPGGGCSRMGEAFASGTRVRGS